MAGADRVVRSRRVLLPEGVRPASVHVRDGRVERVGDYADASSDDFGDLVVMPGLVDTHVHINEPGRTEWEGFATATRAAAAGGITTLVEMPLNAIPATTSVRAFEAKVAAAGSQCMVDIGFWGGVVPGNASEIGPLLEAGCWGFKCFLTPSGVPEFEHVTEPDLRAAMPEIARRGALLMAHAELPAELLQPAGNPQAYDTWLRSRPPRAEDAAIELLIRLARQYGCRVHIVHLVSAASAAQIAAAAGVTTETCPHYLTFAAEKMHDGATEFKCAPPIRDASNREALWGALRAGAIGMIVSDHSPCPPAMKCLETGDFLKAWGGIASLQLSLPAVWSEAVRRGFTVADIARWMCREPARLAGLDHRKGAIAAGLDADFAIWDPEAQFIVDAASLHHRHKLTPYAGHYQRGVVRATWLRGERIDIAAAPRGEVLLRDRGWARLDYAGFLRCCGSSAWARRMTAGLPYASVTALQEAADRAWRECARPDWLEAFGAHPKIGQGSAGRWSRQEQAGAGGADPAVLDRLAELNQRYQEKFGYIYIVCATGKTAVEMLGILERRLRNDPAAEILEAAEQQRQITRLRLGKLLSE